MRILLNTLYVTTPESYLSKDGLNVVISVKGTEVFRIPIHNIEQIVTFGYMGASPGLMKLCADSDVTLTFLSPQGRYIGCFQGPTKGNVLLRQAQYQCAADDAYALHLSQLFIAGKVQNYRNILRRFIRDNGHNDHTNCNNVNSAFSPPPPSTAFAALKAKPLHTTLACLPNLCSISKANSRLMAAIVVPQRMQSMLCFPLSTPSSVMT